jgi:transposase
MGISDCRVSYIRQSHIEEEPMSPITHHIAARQTAIQHPDLTLYASLELSRATWLVTSLAPGSDRMSKHSTAGGDGGALLGLLERTRTRIQQVAGHPVKIVAIQEAGLDGFWVHRLLEANGIESHVVDPASIAVPRRRRRAKTDAIDGETLLRTLLAWKRGEPRVCAMVVPPTPEEEDRRRVCRERAILLRERIRHTNRIKGLLAGQGIADYNPLHKDRRHLLDATCTGDGRPLPRQLKAEILREIELIELLLRQIADVEAAREALARPRTAKAPSPVVLLEQLKGIGPEIASVLYLEGLFRTFGNRRQVAAYAGLAPTPWRSGTVDQEQGISKAGNPRLRSTMIELAWLWQRHQPGSALSRWFHARVGTERGRIRRISIVALARKLLVAIWRYVIQGEIPQGAVVKAA